MGGASPDSEWRTFRIIVKLNDCDNYWNRMLDLGQQKVQEFLNRNRAKIHDFRTDSQVSDIDKDRWYYVYVLYLSDEELE